MTDNLHAALATVQADLPAVGKSKTATVKTKDGGQYQYSYADLAAINDAVLPALAAVGLTWTCAIDRANLALLVGTLTHAATSQMEQTVWPLPATDDPQRLGSAVTYGRRYLLCALVGLAPDDDDDGRRAQQGPAKRDVPEFSVLVDLIAEADAAGVTGDFDATMQWAEESDGNLVAAISRIRKAIAAAVVGGDV